MKSFYRYEFYSILYDLFYYYHTRQVYVYGLNMRFLFLRIFTLLSVVVHTNKQTHTLF